MLLPWSAFGQSTPAFPPGDSQLWEFGIWGSEAVGKALGHDFGNTLLTQAGFHAGRVVYESAETANGKRTIEYTIDIQPLFLVTRPQRAYGGGFSPVGLKWNFTPRGRYRPYLEWNGGAMFTQKNVPPGRTDMFNFTLLAGPGVMIALPRGQALSVAIEYWHLSNADLGHINPAFNTIELRVGYNWMVGKLSGRPCMSQSAGHPMPQPAGTRGQPSP